MSFHITDMCAVCGSMICGLPRIGCMECFQLSSCTAGIDKEATYCGERCLEEHKRRTHLATRGGV